MCDAVVAVGVSVHEAGRWAKAVGVGGWCGGLSQAISQSRTELIALRTPSILDTVRKAPAQRTGGGGRRASRAERRRFRWPVRERGGATAATALAASRTAWTGQSPRVRRRPVVLRSRRRKKLVRNLRMLIKNVVTHSKGRRNSPQEASGDEPASEDLSVSRRAEARYHKRLARYLLRQ